MTVIDEYLATIPKDHRSVLAHIYEVCKKTVSETTDTIGYGMPLLKYKGKYLIGFCSFKNHMSIFPGSEAIEVFKTELEKFKTSKGTVQFSVDKPLPDDIVIKIVRQCARRIEQ